MYFAGFDPTYRFQLWSSNGTAAGTQRLTTGNAASIGPEPAVPDGGRRDGVLLGHRRDARDPVVVEHRDDAEHDDAHQRQRRSGGGLAPTDLTVVGNTLYFTADDGVHGDPVLVEQRDGGRDGDGGGHQRDDDGGCDQPDRCERDGVLRRVHEREWIPGVAERRDGERYGDGHQPGDGHDRPVGPDGGGHDLYFTAPGADLWEWAPPTTPTTPTITWASPAGITYGTALSAAQLDATANVPGTFAYSPAAGTVPGGGDADPLGHLHTHRHHRLHGRHRPIRRSSWRRRTPTITWASPAGIIVRDGAVRRPSSTPRPVCPGPSPIRRRPAPCWRRGRRPCR